MKSLLKKNRYLIVWLGCLPLLLAFAAYTISSEHFDSVQATLSTDAFIAQLQDVLSLVKDAETGQRGYLLTGKPQYLAPYESAVNTVHGRLAALASTAPDNAVPPQEVERLRALVKSKLAEMALTVQLRRNGDAAAALKEVDTGKGQAYMDQLRTFIGQITQEQTSTLTTRIGHQRRDQTLLDYVLGIGVVSGLAVLYLSFRFTTLYSRERDRAEAEIRLINETLELHVMQRTEELEKRTAELERSNADLFQFASIASHDLQEPLRTVSNYVGLLARRYGNQFDESAQTYMTFALDGSRRMQTLISDLLLYSRAGTQRIQKLPVAGGKILQAVLNNLETAICETNAVIVCPELPVIEADETKLMQVFQNLIANAIKFRKPDAPPRVTIGVVRRSNEWVFTVSDEGIGFDEKYTDRIFQVFQRLHGIGKYPGNGIGLALCKRIVEHHGGQLWANSKPNEGSVFSFSLPVRDPVKAIPDNDRSKQASFRSRAHA